MKRVGEVIKHKRKLEKELGVRIVVKERKVIIKGDAIEEYDASCIFEAIDFGFSVAKALLLKDEDYVFKVIHIKDYTKRNLKDVKARLIGTRGKAKKTISEITDCAVVIGEGEVGVIGRHDCAGDAETAIVNIIKGSKQSNMYRYLEKMNRLRKEKDEIPDGKI